MRYILNIFTGTFDAVSAAVSAITNALLMETGDKILLEDGNNIGLES